MKTKRFLVDEQAVGERIDIFLAEELEDSSRNQIQKRCNDNHITINSIPVSKNYRLQKGDTIEVSFYNEPTFELLPENIPLSVLYQDEDILVVDKPKNMVVHPAYGHETGTLANALAYHFPNTLSTIGGEERPGILHRLDKDTSGLLLIARNDKVHEQLAREVKSHAMTRIYQAIVYGEMASNEGTIETFVARHPKVRTRMAVTEDTGRLAITHYKVVTPFSGFTQVQLTLETGRMHQLRLHMEYIGHPIAGDRVYSHYKPIERLRGQCLHAQIIEFSHPTTNQWMQFSSPLPDYFTSFINHLDRSKT